MEIKSTLVVINEKEIDSHIGVTPGQTIQPLVGHPERPTDRMRIVLATFAPNTLEKLHWHPVEAFYYIISGRATVRDFEGKEYDVGPGTSIYAPPGIASAHEWEVKETLQLIAVRATTDPTKIMPFTVEKDTKRSYINLDELIRREGVRFKSHY